MNTLNSLTSIWLAIANDFKTNQLSQSTFSRRCDGAGLPFLMVDMPALGKDLDRALTTGTLVITSRFKTKRDEKYPVFLNEHFEKVFHKDGSLLELPDVSAIRHLRQLLMMFYKYVVPFDPADMQEGFKKFKELDRAVKTDDWHFTLPIVRNHFRSLLPEYPLDIRCHHSSGQTAEKVTNSQKRGKRRYIPSLHATFGLQYFFQSERHYNTWRSDNPIITSEPSARIAFVPKDSRGPRIICMEPHERMFVQKGLQAKLYRFTETMSPAKGFINFTDQSVNQRLACQASIDGCFATIDLQDASDMVSWPLVQQLLRDDPEWLDALRATRSASVQFQDETVVLQKYAPMGSALCFPIEAFVFWAICRTITDKVWVYGDDLIVPNYLSERVMGRLEQYGLIVNRDKSLYRGRFRESCGGEYFRGHDITYVRVKSLNDINFVASANLFGERYGRKLSDELIRLYEQSSGRIVLRGPLSLAAEPRPLVYYTESLASNSVFFNRRWNTNLQRFELKVPTVVDVSRQDKDLSDDDLLFDWMTRTCYATNPLEKTIERDLTLEFGDYHYVMNPKAGQPLERGTQSWSLNTRVKFRWVPETVLADSPTR